MLSLLLRRWRIVTVPGFGALYLHASAPVIAALGLAISGESQSVAFWTGLWAAATVHAAGHALAGKIVSRTTASLTIAPFFGVCRLDHVPVPMTRDLKVTAAGPLANAIVGMALMVLASGDIGDSSWWIPLWAQLQIGYGGVSLLPIFPLDGARILRLALQWRMPEPKAWETAAFVGQASAAGIVLWAIVRGSFFFALIGALLYGIGRFAVFFQTIVKKINEAERTEIESEEDDGMTITMTQAADGVWQPVDTAPRSESRTYF